MWGFPGFLRSGCSIPEILNDYGFELCLRTRLKVSLGFPDLWNRIPCTRLRTPPRSFRVHICVPTWFSAPGV